MTQHNETYGFRVELKEDKSNPDPDEVCAQAARGDYMNESLVGVGTDRAMRGTNKSVPDLLEDLLFRGHFGPFEHPQAYFAVEGISVVVERQITRHRHMSWDVQSMRYVDFDDASTVMPDVDQTTEMVYNSPQVIEELYDHAFEAYEELVEDRNVEPEQARYVLPLGTRVNLSFSANLRALFHFIELRDNAKAQPETRAFGKAVLAEAEEWAPLSFEAFDEKLNNNSLRAP